MTERTQLPHNYEGLVVGRPANCCTHLLAGGAAAYQARLKDPESYFPAAKLPLLEAAVNAKCDLKDGIADGVLNDPRQCDFKPSSLLCKAGQDPQNCFTSKQVVALEKVYRGEYKPR